MHAAFDELTDIAAGRARPGPHLAGCAACREELERVRALRRDLAGLPGFHAPADGLAFARARLRARRAPDRSARHALPLAAGVLALLAAAIFVAARPPSATQPTAAWVPDAALIAESARLEALLAALPEPRRTRLSSAYTVAALEDQLAVVDDQLSAVALEPHAPELSEQLWRERVNVMNSLVQVQYARTLVAR